MTLKKKYTVLKAVKTKGRYTIKVQLHSFQGRKNARLTVHGRRKNWTVQGYPSVKITGDLKEAIKEVLDKFEKKKPKRKEVKKDG